MSTIFKQMIVDVAESRAGMTNLQGRSKRSFIGSLFENDLKTGEHHPILGATRLFERAFDERIDLVDM